MKLSNQKRHWPGYLFGRIRTSTLVLIAAFLAVWWIYETYRPQAPGPGDSPPTQVVPPGFAWQLEAMKDVLTCDKPSQASKKHLRLGFPNGETHLLAGIVN